MDDLRAGIYVVLVGVNLLREGLDLPEVALVAILDADKEGFLRSHRSLTQTAGRAARNVHGRVIMYAKTITPSMQQTIDETERRRMKQLAYNEANGITPRQIRKEIGKASLSALRSGDESKDRRSKAYVDSPIPAQPKVAEAEVAYGKKGKGAKPDAAPQTADQLRKAMREAAARLDFVEAARLRDQLLMIEKK